MAIVSMLYSGDCEDWCTYLVGILNQSHNLAVQRINVDTVDCRSSDVIKNAAQKSQVLILLTTDDFLVYLTNNATLLEDSLAMGPHCFVVVLELFVTDSARLSKTLDDKFKASSSWKRKLLSEIPQRNMEVCGDILDLVELSEKAAQGAAAEATVEKPEQTQGHPRSSSRGKQSSQVELVPRNLYKMKERVVILLKEPATGKITFAFKGESKQPTKKRSDNVYEFTAPDKPRGRYKFYVYEDEQVLGKRWLTYVEPNLDKFSHSPEYLMTCLGQPDLESLDAYLAGLFEHSLPEGDAAQLLSGLMDRSSGESKTSESDFPSLLHWASRWGLNDLVGVLVDAPGASHAFSIKNRRGCDPADLAEDNGHLDLADYIREFMNTKMLVDACADVYQYETMENPVFSGRETVDDYETSTAIAAQRGQLRVPALKVDPAPSVPLRRRNTVPHDRSPSRAQSGPPVPPRDGVPPPRPARPPTRPEKLAPPQNTPSSPREPLPSPRPRPGLPQSPPAVPNRPSSTSSSPASISSDYPCAGMDPRDLMGMRQSDPLPPSAQGSHGQHELLQLLNSVKDGEFTQAEAERLFHAWQQRYGPGKSKSFKDRQAQLQAMRQHCEKLLVTMEDKSKQKTSLLDRLFRKKSAKDPASVIKDISGPLPQPSERTRSTGNIYVRGDSGRFSTSSTASSSSASSDGSRISTTIMEDSDSECHSLEEDDDGTATVQRRSLKKAPAEHRMSRKDHLMLVVNEEEQPRPPPPPPRRHRKTSQKKPVPAPR